MILLSPNSASGVVPGRGKTISWPLSGSLNGYINHVILDGGLLDFALREGRFFNIASIKPQIFNFYTVKSFFFKFSSLNTPKFSRSKKFCFRYTSGNPSSSSGVRVAVPPPSDKSRRHSSTFWSSWQYGRLVRWDCNDRKFWVLEWPVDHWWGNLLGLLGWTCRVAFSLVSGNISFIGNVFIAPSLFYNISKSYPQHVAKILRRIISDNKLEKTNKYICVDAKIGVQ